MSPRRSDDSRHPTPPKRPARKTLNSSLPSLIDTEENRDAALERLREADYLAVDTEFQRESTYFAELCLVQVGTPDTAFAFDARKLDLAPLWTLLLEPDRCHVLHSADQDYELFAQLAGDTPRPLFDTQIAATLLGIGDQIGYAALVEARLGITVDKTLSRTDWTRRPVSEAALQYALDDVIHLAAIYPALRAELEQRGRLAWALEDCADLARAERYRPEPAAAWQRLKGLGRLDGPSQAVAARLAAWREERAIRANRPRRWILKDDLLLAMAERRPADEAGLDALGVGKPGSRTRQELLQLIGGGLYEGVATAQPLLNGARPDPLERKRLAALAARCREIAERLGIPPSYLAPRAELQQLLHAGEHADLRLLRGWRREVAGETLLALRAELLAQGPAA